MKTLIKTQPKIQVDGIKSSVGNGGFTYVTVPWIISPGDEGQIVEFEGKEFYPVMGDMQLGTTTFILNTERAAWREWMNK